MVDLEVPEKMTITTPPRKSSQLFPIQIESYLAIQFSSDIIITDLLQIATSHIATHGDAT